MNYRRQAFLKGYDLTNEGITLYDMDRRFDNANFGNCVQSQEIMEQIKVWIDNPKGFLILRGNPGTGKTFLMVAIYNFLEEKMAEILKRNKFPKEDAWKYFHCYSEHHFLSEMKKYFGYDEKGTTGSRIRKICDIKYLFYDDLGTSGCEYSWQKDLIQEFINTRYNNTAGATVITTNFNNQELMQKIDQKTVDRLTDKKFSVIVDMFGESRRQEPDLYKIK